MTKRNAKGQYVKGSSGNTKGRLKEKPQYLDVLRKSLTFTKWRAIVNKAIEDAIDGDRHARSWLSDYALGKPIQRVETVIQQETLTDELRQLADKVYGDGSEGGLSERTD